MEFYTLPSPAYPADLCEIAIALWTAIPDAAGLRMRLIKASTMEGSEGDSERKVLDFAFLNANLIASRDHVLTAAHQAILLAGQGELKTQTVHSELIDQLNPTSNVAESLRRFGINKDSTSVLLVRIGRALNEAERQGLEQEMLSLTQGTLASLDQLEKAVDLTALKKMYKMGHDDLTPGLITTYTALNKTVGVF